MAIAKKGTRKIIVEGDSYRWVVSPDDEPGLGIVIEKERDHGQRLVAWVKHGNMVTPALVRKVILYALNQGWFPCERRQQMTLRLDDLFVREATSHEIP